MTFESGKFEDRPSEAKSRWSRRANLFWYTATALALAAVVVLFVNIHQLGNSVAQRNDATAAQIAKLSDLMAQQQ